MGLGASVARAAAAAGSLSAQAAQLGQELSFVGLAGVGAGSKTLGASWAATQSPTHPSGTGRVEVGSPGGGAHVAHAEQLLLHQSRGVHADSLAYNPYETTGLRVRRALTFQPSPTGHAPSPTATSGHAPSPAHASVNSPSPAFTHGDAPSSTHTNVYAPTPYPTRCSVYTPSPSRTSGIRAYSASPSKLASTAPYEHVRTPLVSAIGTPRGVIAADSSVGDGSRKGMTTATSTRELSHREGQVVAGPSTPSTSSYRPGSAHTVRWVTATSSPRPPSPHSARGVEGLATVARVSREGHELSPAYHHAASHPRTSLYRHAHSSSFSPSLPTNSTVFHPDLSLSLSLTAAHSPLGRKMATPLASSQTAAASTASRLISSPHAHEGMHEMQAIYETHGMHDVHGGGVMGYVYGSPEAAAAAASHLTAGSVQLLEPLSLTTSASTHKFSGMQGWEGERMVTRTGGRGGRAGWGAGWWGG